MDTTTTTTDALNSPVGQAVTIREAMSLSNVLAASASDVLAPAHNVSEQPALSEEASGTEKLETTGLSNILADPASNANTSASDVSDPSAAFVEASGTGEPKMMPPMPAISESPAMSAMSAHDGASVKLETTSPAPASAEDSEEEEEDEDAAEDDDDDVPDSAREFICMNDEYTRCKTGQYTVDLARKVISDYFGRNKACTKEISAWPLYCRKHYQRATYSKDKWQKRKISLISRQLNVIEEEFPGTTYDVQFKKSEEARLNRYSRQINLGSSSTEASARVAPVEGKSYEAPIDVLRELDQYVGKRLSMAKVQDIVTIIDQMLDDGETEQVPSIEFLPQLPGKSASKSKPAKVRAGKTPKTPSRVSAKGSVKKTNKKA